MRRWLAQGRGIVSAIAFIAAAILSACGKAPPAMNAEALALCQGEPLRSVEKRNAALEAGYDVHRRYDCITKESFASVAAQKAVWDAGHTPAAIAAKKKEFEAQRARYAEKIELERAAEQQARDAPITIDISPREANSASEQELAQMVSIGPGLAAQIVAARSDRPFKDWADIVHRVVGLGAAQTAVYASANGLVVNGQSLQGMPANADITASLYKLYRR